MFPGLVVRASRDAPGGLRASPGRPGCRASSNRAAAPGRSWATRASPRRCTAASGPWRRARSAKHPSRGASAPPGPKVHQENSLSIGKIRSKIRNKNNYDPQKKTIRVHGNLNPIIIKSKLELIFLFFISMTRFTFLCFCNTSSLQGSLVCDLGGIRNRGSRIFGFVLENQNHCMASMFLMPLETRTQEIKIRR